MTNKIKTPWGGGLNSLKPRRAFTLAEVLITLAVIGIVAALTIPTLVSKNEKKQLYTQFMKSYNTIANAINLSTAENGPLGNLFVSSRDNPDYKAINLAIMEKYLFPYLKIQKACEFPNYTECFPESFKTLDGGSVIDAEFFEEFGEDHKAVILQDGSSILFVLNSTDMEIYADVNGFKGPNIYGRDLQVVCYNKDDAGNYFVGPCAGEGDMAGNCDVNSDGSENGWSCSGLLLKEGGMNY